MKIAVKFDKFWGDEENVEFVLAPRQMMVDVYFYESDPLPQIEILESEWITRPDNKMFWVYRQGSFIDVDRLSSLYIVKAKTADLDAQTISVENYHHVPTLSFEGGYRWNGLAFPNELPSSRRVRDDLQDLYTQLVQYRAGM